MTEKTKLNTITRPNGKAYRPRKIHGTTVGNEDEISGVVVFGTHDVEEALPIAHTILTEQLREMGWDDRDDLALVEGSERQVWWRKDLAGFEDNTPYYHYVIDEVVGAAGVRFDVDVTEEGANR